MMTLKLAHQLIPGSRLIGDGAVIFQRVHTDTRSLQAGDLFVAIKGERFDAHNFLAEAKVHGAVAAMAHQGLAAHGLSGLEVNDSKLALGTLAKNWRAYLQAKHDIPVIAVTGSNGKTTLTQMIASILKAWAGEQSLATEGNFNNDIGVPLTLLRLRELHTCAVIELGMNHVGEITELAAITTPTVAVVNNAQREHQEFMGTVEAVARENGAVLSALPANGVAVYPVDDEHTSVWKALAESRDILTFGFESKDNPPSISATFKWQDRAWQVKAQTPMGAIDYALHMAGRHNVKNSLAAIACAIAAEVPLNAIRLGLESFTAVAGRSRTIQIQSGDRFITLLDDSYNANPDSVIAAIDMLMDLPAPRLLVLGDMGEVGNQGAAFHAEVGAYAKTRGIDHFFTLGVLCQHAHPHDFGTHFPNIEMLQTSVDACLQSAAAPASILIKGSRFMKMERITKHLEQTYQETAHAA